MIRPALAALLLVAPALTWAEETEVSFVYVPAPHAESLVIDQPLGQLSLHGWDKPEVRIVARKHAKDSATLEQLRVNVDMFDDGRVRIRTGVRVGNSFRALPRSEAAGIDLEIEAPRRVTLRATTWADDLEVSGFRAGAELFSRGGAVRASDIEGSVHTQSLEGKQQLTAIRGDVEADVSSGDVVLESVDGKLLEARVVEGQITARDVRSHLVRLFSTIGGIVLIGAVRQGARYELTVLNGDIRLQLPRSPFSLHARAPGGIKNPFQLMRAVGSPTELSGDFLGGGPQLELVSSHGVIELEPSP
jgi:hypothetical protein